MLGTFFDDWIADTVVVGSTTSSLAAYWMTTGLDLDIPSGIVGVSFPNSSFFFSQNSSKSSLILSILARKFVLS